VSPALEELDHALHLDLGNEGAVDALQHAAAGGMKSMSPLPSRVSAPMESRMVRESMREKTRKEMRRRQVGLDQAGDDVDARPLGARIRWMPAARAICARRAIDSSTSRPATIIRSASSSTMTTM